MHAATCHAPAVGARDVSVVVPSHGRPLRLRWLLNALESQTLERSRFEVIVVHDYDDQDSESIIGRHPLTAAGVIRQIRIEPGTGSPSRQRNLGWRGATAPLIAFTDDDCRPDPEWLATLREAAVDQPGAILQGTTRPDPLETDVFAAPHHRSLYVDPPDTFAQTCNIAYPRAALQSAGGFDERIDAGDDTDLGLRVRATGARLVPVPGALMFHAVESFSLPAAIRVNRKWQDLPYVLRRHPQLRSDLLLGVFWRSAHAELLLAGLGLSLAGRRPIGAVLAVPYLRTKINRRGKGRRARLACAVELPGQILLDVTTVATMVRGSLRHRTLLL
jgi:GT2 family glycosyltransferase